MKRKLMVIAVLATSPGLSAASTTWTTTIDAANYGGSTGVITFNDWGYTGPTGVGVDDFQVGSGFDSSSIGQIQHVVTQTADWATPDPASTVYGDLSNSPQFSTANMDGGVNFYKWGYTTPSGSTFSNMQIDTAGNYFIAKEDMSFGTYDVFNYRDMTASNPDQTYDTRINFKPYTVSNATGWCGSVLASSPDSLEQMAGQVTFDFAMDIYFDFGGAPVYSSTQLVSGFVMRSYGHYSVNVSTAAGDQQIFYGSAVGNNTNPESVVAGLGGTLDPAYLNDVSFLGAGVLPTGEWVSADSFNADGTKKMRADYNPTTGAMEQVWDVTIVEEGTPGAVWHANSFAGFAYILRADGMRILDYINPQGFSDYQAAPVPEAETYMMMAVGFALVGVAVRRRRRR